MVGLPMTVFGLDRKGTVEACNRNKHRRTMKNRKFYLEFLLREAVRILREQDPAGLGSAVPPSPVPPAPATNATPPTGPQATDGSQLKPFDVDQMIERLNIIRGGRSFADPEVYGQLTTYFKGLNDADKAAIDRFLQSINRIVVQVDNVQGTSMGGGAQPPMNQGTPPVAAATAPAIGVQAVPGAPGVPGTPGGF